MNTLTIRPLPRPLKVIGAVGALALCGVGLTWIFLKPLVSWGLGRVVGDALGLDVRVDLDAFRWGSARGVIALVDPPLRLEGVEVAWGVSRSLPPRWEARLAWGREALTTPWFEGQDLRLVVVAAGAGLEARSGEFTLQGVGLRSGESLWRNPLVTGRLGESLRLQASIDGPPGPVGVEWEGTPNGAGRALGLLRVKVNGWAAAGPLQLEVPPGGRSGSFEWDATLARSPSGLPRGPWELSGQWGEGAQGLKLKIPSGDGAVKLSTPLELAVSLSAEGLRLQGNTRGNPWLESGALRGDGLDVQLSLAGDQWDGGGSLPGVRWEGVTQPMTVRWTLSGPKARPVVAVEVQDLLGTNWAQGKGEWSDGGGGFTLSAVTPEGADLSNLLHSDLGEWVYRRGSWEGRGELRWEKGKLRTSGRVKVEGLGLEVEGIPIDGVEGEGAFTSLVPLRLRQTQTWKVRSAGSSVPVTEFRAELGPRGKEVWVQDLSARVGGGTLKAAPFRLGDEIQATLLLTDVDAAQVLEGSGMGNLKARGKLSGKLPLHWKDGSLWVEGGQLSAVAESGKEAGWVQYKDPTVADLTEKVEYLDQFEALIARGQHALAFKALDNFFFKKLAMDIRRTPDKGTEVMLGLEGHNPDLAKGMPFQFNVGLSGQLESAVKQSVLRAMMKPEAFANYLKRK